MKTEAADIIETMYGAGMDCIELFDMKKGGNPLFMDLRGVNSYLDFFVIVTGNSQLHCRALAKEAGRFLTEKGLREKGKPDYNSPWIILDHGDLIVHVFLEEARSYYNLERLWADAEIIRFKQKGELNESGE